MAKRYHAIEVFDQLAALNKDIDAGVTGALKAKRALSNSWTDRRSNNAGDCFKASKAKPAPCYITKG